MEKNLPIDKMGNILNMGDKVTIIGNLNFTEQLTYVSEVMESLINTDLEFKVEDYKPLDAPYINDSRYIIRAGGWYWSNLNILKQIPILKIPTMMIKNKEKKFTFDTVLLDL